MEVRQQRVVRQGDGLDEGKRSDAALVQPNQVLAVRDGEKVYLETRKLLLNLLRKRNMRKVCEGDRSILVGHYCVDSPTIGKLNQRESCGSREGNGRQDGR